MDSNQVSNQFTIDNIISEPNIFLKNSTQQQLEKIIQQSNNTYYNNESIMSDEIYDILKDGLVQLYPKSKLVNSIGSTVTSNKVKLPTHLGSMSKIKPDTGELKKWLTKFTGKKVS